MNWNILFHFFFHESSFPFQGNNGRSMMRNHDGTRIKPKNLDFFSKMKRIEYISKKWVSIRGNAAILILFWSEAFFLFSQVNFLAFCGCRMVSVSTFQTKRFLTRCLSSKNDCNDKTRRKKALLNGWWLTKQGFYFFFSWINASVNLIWQLSSNDVTETLIIYL